MSEGDPEKLKAESRVTQLLRQHAAWMIRKQAERGRYNHTKATSRFSNNESNLPLDLWDSTPDE